MTDFEIKAPEDIRDDWLRTKRNGLIKRGVANPNVGPGSDDYVSATAFGNELAVAQANAIIKADASMPDTATGTDLDNQLVAYGMSRRPAGGSAGPVVLDATQSTTIVAGTQLLDQNGLVYQTVSTQIYAPGQNVAVVALGVGQNVGLATNHAQGDILRWQTPPIFANATALVGAGGLTGGIEIESDEPARIRLLAHLQNPPGSGNAQHLAEIAEGASVLVEKAHVYPAAQGPASAHVAVTTYATTTATVGAQSASRAIDPTTLATVVVTAVTGNYPEHAGLTITGTVDQAVDVAIALALPASPSGTPPGPGGGWLDGSPWPFDANVTGTFKCTVTGVTSSSVFTVDAPSAPAAGASRIAFLAPGPPFGAATNWTLYTARVLAVSGSAGAYTITIDQAFVGIAVGNYIMPQAQNLQTYVSALLNAFKAMGPGEKSNAPVTLQRAFRHPPPQIAWPYSLGDVQLRALTNSGPEVITAKWNYRSLTTPSVPGTISQPPNILVPRNIGFYPA